MSRLSDHIRNESSSPHTHTYLNTSLPANITAGALDIAKPTLPAMASKWSFSSNSAGSSTWLGGAGVTHKVWLLHKHSSGHSILEYWGLYTPSYGYFNYILQAAVDTATLNGYLTHFCQALSTASAPAAVSTIGTKYAETVGSPYGIFQFTTYTTPAYTGVNSSAAIGAGITSAANIINGSSAVGVVYVNYINA